MDTAKVSDKNRSVIMWIVAMILCPLGVALSTKAGLGVSMIEAPVFACYHKLKELIPAITVGTVEYIVQALLLVILCIAIRRFRLRYLLSFVTAVIYGLIIDGWLLVFGGTDVYESMTVRIICFITGAVIIAFAVACFFRTDLPLEVWELFVKELSDRYSLNITKVKWIYDLSSLAVAFILMFVFFHGFRTEVIGIGTIIVTFINAPIIGFFGKILDKIK